MTSPPTNGVLSLSAIKFWMPVIITLISLAVSWGVWTTRLTAVEAAVAVNETKIEIIGTTFTEIKVHLAEMQRDIMYIREQIDKR